MKVLFAVIICALLSSCAVYDSYPYQSGYPTYNTSIVFPIPLFYPSYRGYYGHGYYGHGGGHRYRHH